MALTVGFRLLKAGRIRGRLFFVPACPTCRGPAPPVKRYEHLTGGAFSGGRYLTDFRSVACCSLLKRPACSLNVMSAWRLLKPLRYRKGFCIVVAFISGDSKGKSMLSVSECAQILGVSTARVRQLIASGSLEATKVGRSWVLPEAAVYDRLLKNPSSGRPSSSSDDLHSERMASSAESRCDLPRLFEECKKAFSFCVPLDVLQSAKTQEEADFYIELSDFFLRQKQRELVKRGVY